MTHRGSESERKPSRSMTEFGADMLWLLISMFGWFLGGFAFTLLWLIL